VSYSDDIVFDMFVISILNSNFKYQFLIFFGKLPNTMFPISDRVLIVFW
jgi:hypothetical protein